MCVRMCVRVSNACCIVGGCVFHHLSFLHTVHEIQCILSFECINTYLPFESSIVLNKKQCKDRGRGKERYRSPQLNWIKTVRQIISMWKVYKMSISIAHYKTAAAELVHLFLSFGSSIVVICMLFYKFLVNSNWNSKAKPITFVQFA